MAKLGYRTFKEMIGHSEKLFFNPDATNEKAKLLDFLPILTSAKEMNPAASTAGGTMKQDFALDKRLVSNRNTKKKLFPCKCSNALSDNSLISNIYLSDSY